jgi:hypothetical protein
MGIKLPRSRYRTARSIVYMAEGVERGTETADPRLLEKTGGKEDWRRQA